MAKADAKTQWFEGSVVGDEFTIASSSGDATLTGRLTAEGISGELNLPDKWGRNYFAPPAGEGAGIYTVQVAGDRRLTGASEQGAKLDLGPNGDAMAGRITAPDGTSFDVRIIDPATAYRSGNEYGRPDTYVALVAPRGRYVFGRSAELLSGRSPTNLVSLQKHC